MTFYIKIEANSSIEGSSILPCTCVLIGLVLGVICVFMVDIHAMTRGALLPGKEQRLCHISSCIHDLVGN